MKVAFYKSASGRAPAQEFVDGLSDVDYRKIDTCIKAIRQYGLDALGLEFKFIADKLWEIKIRSVGGSYRLFYVTFQQEVMVILHGYKKQSQKAPIKELDIAKQRMKEVLENETSYCY